MFGKNATSPSPSVFSRTAASAFATSAATRSFNPAASRMGVNGSSATSPRASAIRCSTPPTAGRASAVAPAISRVTAASVATVTVREYDAGRAGSASAGMSSPPAPPIASRSRRCTTGRSGWIGRSTCTASLARSAVRCSRNRTRAVPLPPAGSGTVTV